MNLKVKDKITISCSGSCNPDDSRIIYGTDLYAPETGLCIGAFHSGSIHLNGGKFAIEIMPGQAIYKSS